MPEKINYLVLACQMIAADPKTLLSFHQYSSRLSIITAEGKKYTFNFKQLEDFHQYLLDNQPAGRPEPPVLSGIAKTTSNLAPSKSTVKEVDLSRKAKKSRTAKAPNHL